MGSIHGNEIDLLNLDEMHQHIKYDVSRLNNFRNRDCTNFLHIFGKNTFPKIINQ